jgi:hypothetical protein
VTPSLRASTWFCYIGIGREHARAAKINYSNRLSFAA